MTDKNLHQVVSEDDLDDGDRAVVDIEGIEIAVFNVEGEYRALANYCVHQGGPVAEGLISGTVTCKMTDDDWDLEYDQENELLACPWHGWQFELKSGNHTAHTNYSIPSFEVIVKNGVIFVEL